MNDIITKNNAKTTQKIEAVHINNMVGVNLKKNLSKPQKSDSETRHESILKDIKEGKKSSRILLDLFAVSLSPKITKKGYRLSKKNIHEMDKNWNITEKEVVKKTSNDVDFHVLELDQFFEFFIETFSDIFELKNMEEFSAGKGYNAGRRYSFGENGAIQFKYFDYNNENVLSDEKYASGSAFENYIRQSINMKIMGNGLQILRSEKKLVRFLKRLYETFETDVSMFDATCDFFNYDLYPKIFGELYQKDFYIGKSKVQGFGDLKEVNSIYVGAYKGARTIMLYDKLVEELAKGRPDEPDLISALENCDGNWMRLEQHFTREQKEANQAFNFIMKDVLSKTYSENIEDIFYKNLSEFLKQHVEKKCRFLSQKRKEKNNERIKTHKKWQLIIDVICDTKSDFSFERPLLTLDDRMRNFKFKSLGGKQLFKDIILERGYDSLISFLNDCAEFARYELEHENDSLDNV